MIRFTSSEAQESVDIAPNDSKTAKSCKKSERSSRHQFRIQCAQSPVNLKGGLSD